MRVQPQAARMVTVIRYALDVFQVTDATVLKRTKRVQGHTRQFCSEWFKSYPWLVLCVTKLKAYRVYCRYTYRTGFLTDKLGEVAFITAGFNNWKKALLRFEHHSQCSSHKEAVIKIEPMKQPDVVCMLDNTQTKSGNAQKDATNHSFFLEVSPSTRNTD